jgi:hypothetical protein
MTDQERNEFREFNGRMIEEMCEIGEKIIDLHVSAIRKSAAENAGMTPTQYQQAEALYLYGDLSGRE